MLIRRIFRVCESGEQGPDYSVRGMLVYYDGYYGTDNDYLGVLIKFVPDDDSKKHRVFLMKTPPEPELHKEVQLEGDGFFVYGERPVTDPKTDIVPVVRIPIKCKVKGVMT